MLPRYQLRPVSEVLCKQEVPHVEGCRAQAAVDAGTWNTPWWWPGSYRRQSTDPPDQPFEPRGVVRRDAIGRRTRYTSSGRPWLVLECNCTACPGRMIVNLDVLLRKVPAGV